MPTQNFKPILKQKFESKTTTFPEGLKFSTTLEQVPTDIEKWSITCLYIAVKMTYTETIQLKTEAVELIYEEEFNQSGEKESGAFKSKTFLEKKKTYVKESIKEAEASLGAWQEAYNKSGEGSKERAEVQAQKEAQKAVREGYKSELELTEREIEGITEDIAGYKKEQTEIKYKKSILGKVEGVEALAVEPLSLTAKATLGPSYQGPLIAVQAIDRNRLRSTVEFTPGESKTKKAAKIKGEYIEYAESFYQLYSPPILTNSKQVRLEFTLISPVFSEAAEGSLSITGGEIQEIQSALVYDWEQ